MRKSRPLQLTLRVDSHVAAYLVQMPGDNPAEKIRSLVNDGIEYRRRINSIIDNSFPSKAEVHQ